MTLEEATPPPFRVWPENWPSASVFVDMDTQWRVGAHGPTGFDYAALPVVFRMRGIHDADQPRTYDGLRVMEAAALKYMHREK